MITFMLIMFAWSQAPTPALHNAKASMWKFKKTTKGLHIYTRKKTNSKYKELKIETTFEGRLSSIVGILKDHNAYPTWMYNCKKTKHLKTINATEEITATLFHFPWPATNRYIVTQGKIKQHPITKVVTIESWALANHPVKALKGVRIKQMTNKWILTPRRDGTIKVVYYLHSNPGGSIPAGLVNMLMDKGPVKTIHNMKQQLKAGKYDKVQFGYIDE